MIEPTENVLAQESTHEEACVKTAVANGHTPEQANNCEAGDLNCEGCPWAKE